MPDRTRTLAAGAVKPWLTGTGAESQDDLLEFCKRRKVPVNETSIILRAAGVLFPGDVMDRGAEEVMTLPDIRAKVLLMPHHGKWFHLHAEFVRRVAPETILVSAPEGYYSEKVILALPILPRITGRDGAIEMPLK